MWVWTKCFGTSIWSIRLPSALLGIACVPLLFWLATLTEQRMVGWLAAALLAVNGFHVFWSKVARMFSLACFLGLLATILLVRLARESRPRRTLQVAYVLVILLGLASHIFFWALFLTHILWTFLNAWSRKTSMPGLCKLQILILILGSPLLAFAAYQSGSPLATLDRNIFSYAKEFVQFSFLLPQPMAANLPPLFPWYSYGQPQFWVSRGLLFVFSLLLLVLGIGSVKPANEKLLTDLDGPSPRLWIVTAGLGLLAILTFVVMAKKFVARPNDTLQLTKIMSLLPVSLAGLGIVLQRTWGRLPNSGRRLVENRFFVGSQALVTMLAVVPFACLSVISLFKPFLNQRGMLFVVPYLLFVLARGMVSLARSRWVAVLLFILVGVLHGSSLMAYSVMRVDDADYRRVAAMLTPHIEKTDLVFLYRSWNSTPILYYLTADRYRLVAQDYREACKHNPNARVWVLLLYDQEVSREMAEALADYRVVQRFEMPFARGLLYSPRKL